MCRLIPLAPLFILAVGCNGDDKPLPATTKDAAPVYEAVLQVELKATKQGEGWFLFVDGKDPAPELLTRIQKRWPKLQAGSKVAEGKADRVSLSDLKWVNSDTAEVVGATSNGIDGRSSRFRVVRKDGVWIVDSAKVESRS